MHRKVLAVLHRWNYDRLLEMMKHWRKFGQRSRVWAEISSDQKKLMDKSGYQSSFASSSVAKAAATKQHMWLQICQPWLEARRDVAVLQREPGWTDREEDFDRYWGKKNLYDKPKQEAMTPFIRFRSNLTYTPDAILRGSNPNRTTSCGP